MGPLGAADVAGAHTRALLAEIGFEDAAVELLLAADVVGAPQVRA